LHPDPAKPPTEGRGEIVDRLVSALAIETAATEEILFPVLRDLVNEDKTWEEDQVVSREGTQTAARHPKNVFVG
jgi:hypothetical protein